MGLARLLAKADADHVWCIAGFALEIATNDHFGFPFNGIRAWQAGRGHVCQIKFGRGITLELSHLA
jgi:hypothetical protein